MDSNPQRDSSKLPDTSYLNISGNEIALRVALCDLVQRLKRSEFMCKYLEQCRNELASEVIRLRAHNDQILKEFALHSSNSDQNSSTPNQLILPGYRSPIQDGKSNLNHKLGNRSTIKLDSFTDESWEEISNRLINELKQEMMNAELSDDEEEEFDSATEQPGSDQAFYEPSNEQFEAITDQLNGSSSTNLTNLNKNNNVEQATTNADDYEIQEQHMAINDPPAKPIPSYLLKSTSDSNDGNVSKADLKAFGISNRNDTLKVIEVCGSEVEQRKFDLNALIKSFASEIKSDDDELNKTKKSSFDVVESILNNYNVDLEEITKQVLINNERLLKLKGKHLRNYFRRQLDHTNSAEGNVS